MTLLDILKILAAVGTILTGAVSLIWPRAIRGFTGLDAPGPRGVTEIRAVLGGAFIGLGTAPLILNTAQAYQMLGITYLAIGLARTAGMVLDKSVERSNLISLAVEVAFVIILLL